MNSERIFSHRKLLPRPSGIKFNASMPFESVVAPKSNSVTALLSSVRRMNGAAFGTGLRKQLSRLNKTNVKVELKEY